MRTVSCACACQHCTQRLIHLRYRRSLFTSRELNELDYNKSTQLHDAFCGDAHHTCIAVYRTLYFCFTPLCVGRTGDGAGTVFLSRRVDLG